MQHTASSDNPPVMSSCQRGALGHSAGDLVVARTAQGVAAAGILPMTLSLMSQLFPDRTARVKAVNTITIIASIAMVIGLFMGGVLTQLVRWRSIFWLNVPAGLIGAWLAVRYLPRFPLHQHPMDLVSTLVAMVSLCFFISGLIESGLLPLLHPRVYCALGVVGMVAFVMIEQRVQHPILPLAVFRQITFTVASLGGMAFGMALLGGLGNITGEWALWAARTGMLLISLASLAILLLSLRWIKT